MTPIERRSTFLIAGIYSFRMLGLFMVLPVLSLDAPGIARATPMLIGFALGIYGLMQALLQLPFGMLSDRVGRKPIIIFGLILFIGGSVLAAFAQNIHWIIIGRALQGSGAIGSTLIALVADVTSDKSRLKAMSVIGITIGFAFVAAMMLGPILNSLIGLSGIFWVTAALAAFGLVALFFIPTPQTIIIHDDAEPVAGQFKKVLLMPSLLRLDFGIFALHAILTALFIVVPLILIQNLGMAANKQWLIYLPVLVLAAIAMVPFVILAETRGLMRPLFTGAIVLITLVAALLPKLHHALPLCIALFLFFTAFTFLEACLPSLISKTAPAHSKGTAMGIYSSCQFLGIFVGGALGGFIFQHFGAGGIFAVCALLGFLWLIVTAGHTPASKHVSIK